MVLANLRLSLANPPDFYTFTSRNCSGFHKMKFGLGKSAGANDAGERFVQAHICFSGALCIFHNVVSTLDCDGVILRCIWSGVYHPIYVPQ